MTEQEVLVRVEDLIKHFPVARDAVGRRRPGHIRAVDGISFEIYRGETLGLVGESGCGKSTAGRTILQLYRPTGGRVIFRGKDLTELKGRELRGVRPHMQMVFQDPYASLNPRMTVGQLISEPLLVHTRQSRAERQRRVRELLELVGLDPDLDRRYPHEFSGGQRQRIGVARALALNPEFIICDEPISALDVSVQAQVVNLLEDLQERFGLTYLFIAHDLSMVRHICTRVAVMYLGKLMELGPREAVYNRPLHPYTRALLSAVPVPDPDLEAEREPALLTGDVPSPADPPSGCFFRTRCSLAADICRAEVPAFREVRPGHYAACHFVPMEGW
ncbi:MAG: ATP-binding cassette domain-containing protein [Anaerolineales bacterium]|nr:ATP-binding cassette domain-containing protein [Anaerolineales bacterium]